MLVIDKSQVHLTGVVHSQRNIWAGIRPLVPSGGAHVNEPSRGSICDSANPRTSIQHLDPGQSQQLLLIS